MSILTEQGMTFGDLADHVYFLADEEPNIVFKTRDVYRLINIGLRRVVSQVGYPTVTAFADVDAGVRDYQLLNAMPAPGEDADVLSVYLYDTSGQSVLGALGRVAVDDSPGTSGQPTNYSINGETIRLYPTPDVDYSIAVRYKTTLETVTSTTTVLPLSPDEIEAAGYYAVWQMKLRDDEYNNADRWRAEYIDAMKRLSGPRPGVYKGV